MNRTLGLTALAASLVASSTAFARPLEEMKKSGEIRICVVLYPEIVEATPAGCKPDKCKFSGPAYEVAAEYAKHLNLKPKFEILSWDDQFVGEDGKTDKEGEYTPTPLKSGKCDVYPTNVTVLPWREKKMAMIPLFPSRKMILTNAKKKSSIPNYKALGGKTAVVVESTSFHTWLTEINAGDFKDTPIKIVLTKPGEDLKHLAAGKADFALMDADGALSAVKKDPKNLATAFPVGSADNIGWGVSKDHKDLQESVQAFFKDQQSKTDSKLNSVWKTYFGMSFIQYKSFMEQVAK